MALEANKTIPRRISIAETYVDDTGRHQRIDRSTQAKLLSLLSAEGINDQPIPPVKVWREGEPVTVWVQGDSHYRWTFHYEQGGMIEGEIVGGTVLTLPGPLPQGYHRLTLEQAGRRWRCQAIIAPMCCYEPDALSQGKRWWGVSVQLYTLCSQHNWGVGDFGDLKTLLEEVARRGGAFVGLNPLHALSPSGADNANPYSPSSRYWINTIYIDVNHVDDFLQSEEAQRWWQSAETQHRLSTVRGSRWVDYRSVAALKLDALRLSFQHFNLRGVLDPRQLAFQQFIARGGDRLQQHATYDALNAWLERDGHSFSDWSQWPECYQDARGDSVVSFRESHAEDVMFYCWLQWLAHEQLAACYDHSKQLGMPLGLYREVAEGVACRSADSWQDHPLFCHDASIGDVPQTRMPHGQSGPLAPINPVQLQCCGYQPFIDMIRSNMAHTSAICLHHVASLMREWWVPQEGESEDGGFIYYPVDDLLAILALESQRHRCMVMGDEQGVLPEGMVSKLRDCRIYSCRVLFFERNQQGEFYAPQDYPPRSMATVTTHDLPTLRGYWQSIDLILAHELGLCAGDVLLSRRLKAREQAKQALLDALHQYGHLPQRVGRNATLTTMSAQLNRGVQRYLAESASGLLGLRLEEWLDMATPVCVPGGEKQYPNWRRKLSRTLDSIFGDSYLERLIRDIDLRRNGPLPSRDGGARAGK
ncbi:4-alpha-glucanotransferase [Lonsdalea quercina]|uniref:4-alpha-glucanotransferase n=1 Tax=Lonsdalea quercina TaxID=71657 RepID=UPI003975FCC1